MQPAQPQLSGTEQTPPTLAGRTVLIADDDPVVLDILAARFRKLGLRVETATDGLRALLKITKEKPDFLILDLMLPDVDGFKVVERLTDPKFPPLPVIALTARSDEAAIRRCDELGILYVHKDGDVWHELDEAIRKIFVEKQKREAEPKVEEQTPAQRPPRILIVDDDPAVLRSLAFALQTYDLEIIQAPNGMQGFWLALRTQPDLVVTDYNMEQGSGNYLLSRIKSTPSVKHIPVIVFTGQSMEEGQMHAMRRDLRGRGQAAGFITKPAGPSALIEEIRKYIPLRDRH